MLEGVAKPLPVREHQKCTTQTMGVGMEVAVAVVEFEEVTVVEVAEIAAVAGLAVETAKFQIKVAVGVSALNEVVFSQHLAAANHQEEEETGEIQVTVELDPDGQVEANVADSAFHLVRSAQMSGKRERKTDFVALVLDQLVGCFEGAEERKRREVEK